MNNKYLISVFVPVVELEFELYIPINKKIGTIKSHILKQISDTTNNVYDKSINDVRMLDRLTGEELDNNAFVKDTIVKNGSKIIII